MNWDILKSDEVRKLERLIVNRYRAEYGEVKHEKFDTTDFQSIAFERKMIIDRDWVPLATTSSSDASFQSLIRSFSPMKIVIRKNWVSQSWDIL